MQTTPFDLFIALPMLCIVMYITVIIIDKSENKNNEQN